MAKKFSGAFYLSFLDRSMSLVVGNELEAFRRTFVSHAASAGFFAGVSLPSLSAKHHSSDRFKLGLSQYSLRALLKNGSLDALDFPQFTVDKFGIKAIDLWEGGLPKDKLDDAKYLQAMRKRAQKAGTELFLLMSGALDASPPKKGSEFGQDPGFLPTLRSIGRSFGEGFPQSPRYGGGGRSFGKRGSPQAIGG